MGLEAIGPKLPWSSEEAAASMSNCSAFRRVYSRDPGPNAGKGGLYGFAAIAVLPPGILDCRSRWVGTGWKCNYNICSGMDSHFRQGKTYCVVHLLVIFEEDIDARQFIVDSCLPLFFLFLVGISWRKEFAPILNFL